MAERSLLTFAGYAVDRDNEQLWRGEHVLRVTNKAFAVLRYLVEHPGQLVTKDALFAAIWSESIVSETTLTNCIGELRQALGDDPKQPQFIETVHRRGYRFIEKVVSSQYSVVSRDEESQKSKSFPTQSSVLSPQSSVLVGREVELVQLHNLFAKALNGERQLVFVTGEAGIGKTALVDAFLFGVRSREEFGVEKKEESQKSKIQAQKPVLSVVKGSKVPESQTPNSELPLTPIPWIAHGQCVEHYGAGEAYLPVLEALGRLGRQPGGERLLTILDRYALTWLVQLPALLSAAALEAVQHRVQGATRERMLREIADAFEVLTAEQPLVLVLEDLHWSDPSTVELLAMLARRREAARLLVLGTYRAAELVVANHPLKILKQELVARGQCAEIPLSALSRAAVRAYVVQRLPDDDDAVVDFVYQRTDGQPLFMVQITDYLAQREGLTSDLQAEMAAVEQALPQGLRELIAAQLGRLTEEEQHVLEVGSVAGAEFVVASVAAGLAVGAERIEAVCDGLAQRGQFIEDREVAEWPDGTVSARYAFRHALYQEALYARVTEARRVRLHRQLGERLEAGNGERAGDLAAELAVHFERGRDTDRAVLYLQKAGENALRRYAYQEALGHLQKAVAVLRTLPQTTDRARRELALQFCLVQALAAVKGHASIEVERAYLYAQTLCEQVGTTQQLFFVLLGLFRLRHGHCEYQHARDLGAQCLALAQREQDPTLFFPAYYASGASELYLGNFAVAENYLTQGIQCYDTRHDATYVALYGNASPYTSCYAYTAIALWYLGYPDQALRHLDEMLQIAKGFASPLTLAGARGFAPLVYHCCRQGAVVQEQGEEGIAVATRMGFPFWRAIGLFWRGWGLAEQGHYEEGIQQMQQGLSAQRDTGSSIHRVHFSVLLAEAYGHAGQHEEGLRLLTEAEAAMEQTDERLYEGELWRIKGELLLNDERGMQKDERKTKAEKQETVSIHHSSFIIHRSKEAEACFLKAISIAHQQQAKSLELRAVMSLVRSRQQQVTNYESRNTNHATRTALADAHSMLSEVYGWFTEGFDTKDLQEAKALLEDFGERRSEERG